MEHTAIGVERSSKIDEDIRGTKTIGRAMEILNLLAQNSSGLTLTEIAVDLNLPKSTAHRILRALIERQAVREIAHGDIYVFGYELPRLSFLFLERLDLVREARPFLRQINKQVNETVHLAVLDEPSKRVVYVDKVDSSQSVGMSTRIGQSVPVHCTALGKAMLSCLRPDDLEDFIKDYTFKRYTPQTIADPESFREELRQVRACGYAVDRSEQDPQVACVGAPICNRMGEPLAAISISAPLERFDENRRQEAAPVVVKAAKDISSLLAYMRKR